MARKQYAVLSHGAFVPFSDGRLVTSDKEAAEDTAEAIARGGSTSALFTLEATFKVNEPAVERKAPSTDPA